MRRLLRVCVVALALVGLPLAASAQPALADDDHSGLISAGALVGAEMDTPDNWLMFGVDARVKVAHGLEFEPRFTYQPLGGGHTIQLDANVLKNLDLARPGRFHPFFGIGGTLQKVSPDGGNGDSTLGLNLIDYALAVRAMEGGPDAVRLVGMQDFTALAREAASRRR